MPPHQSSRELSAPSGVASPSPRGRAAMPVVRNRLFREEGGASLLFSAPSPGLPKTALYCKGDCGLIDALKLPDVGWFPTESPHLALGRDVRLLVVFLDGIAAYGRYCEEVQGRVDTAIL